MGAHRWGEWVVIGGRDAKMGICCKAQAAQDVAKELMPPADYDLSKG